MPENLSAGPQAVTADAKAGTFYAMEGWSQRPRDMLNP